MVIPMLEYFRLLSSKHPTGQHTLIVGDIHTII